MGGAASAGSADTGALGRVAADHAVEVGAGQAAGADTGRARRADAEQRQDGTSWEQFHVLRLKFGKGHVVRHQFLLENVYR
jgi:hypothetical protein